MRNKKIKKFFCIIISLEVAISFIIKIIIDYLQKSFTSDISNIFLTKMVILSILISLTFFIILVYFQLQFYCL